MSPIPQILPILHHALHNKPSQKFELTQEARRHLTRNKHYNKGIFFKSFTQNLTLLHFTGLTAPEGRRKIIQENKRINQNKFRQLVPGGAIGLTKFLTSLKNGTNQH